MKKPLMYALALSLMLLLTGCVGQDTSAPSASPAAQATSAPSSAPSDAPSDAPLAQGAGELKDGAYTAQTSEAYAAASGYGWREYLNVTISGGKVTEAEYDARMDDKRKCETTQDEYNMTPHPSQWIPQLSESVKNAQTPEDIDIVTGATHSSQTVRKLYAAILKAAETGDTAAITIEE